MDPLWNSLVVGGLQDGKPFLGTIGMIGVHYTDGHIATGALPSAHWQVGCPYYLHPSVALGHVARVYACLRFEVALLPCRVWLHVGQAALQGEAPLRHD